jgi:hypothetical protein
MSIILDLSFADCRLFKLSASRGFSDFVQKSKGSYPDNCLAKTLSCDMIRIRGLFRKIV